jgi:hypothetical protein
VRRNKLESLTAQAADEPVPPPDLPEGTTIVDLPDDDVRERAEFSAALFEFASDKVKEFVAAGCPLEDDEDVRSNMTFALQMSLSTFRGAKEWRKAHGPAVSAAVQDGALGGRPEDAPAVLKAAIWVDEALKAEEEFRALLQAHAPRLAAAERKRLKANRSRVH